ncbi:hypothetical protein CK203_045673 [Vitis vinifera]|uniref:Uncharacterized protein n=1 Tax=Vitis vinifera TaxID=29760 RepID=A0A438HQ58_VITVI|nr:hypothetical protein CK203_045673 [Vitis vinifera]
MTAYRAKQPELPQPAEIPAARRASPNHILEGIPIASPTISKAPPVTPASSEPSTSTEPRMAIPIQSIEIYAAYCRPLLRLRAALLRRWQLFELAKTDVDHPGSAYCHLEQLQHHLGLPLAAEHLTPTIAVPHS